MVADHGAVGGDDHEARVVEPDGALVRAVLREAGDAPAWQGVDLILLGAASPLDSPRQAFAFVSEKKTAHLFQGERFCFAVLISFTKM